MSNTADDKNGNHDAIRLDGHVSFLLAKNIVIDVTGYKSDGINLTFDLTSNGGDNWDPRLEAQNVDITVNSLDGNAYGVRANSSKSTWYEGRVTRIKISNDATIRMLTGGLLFLPA